MNAGFTNLAEDIVVNILGFIRAEDCGKIALCNKSTNDISKRPFLTEMSFSKNVDKKVVQQHAQTLKILEVPNMKSIDGISLPNLEQLLVSREVKHQTDFSMYPKLKCLGLVAFNFPKVSGISIPKNLEFFYTTYQLSTLQIQSVENSSDNLKTLLVYYPDLNVGSVYKSANPHKSFMKKWARLEDAIGRCCQMYAWETMGYMHQNCEEEEEEEDSDDSDYSDEEAGDYDLFQYGCSSESE